MKNIVKSQKLKMAKKTISYILVALLLYILQNSVGFLSIFGVKPMLLIPFALSIAMFESLTFSAVFSIVIGFMCDTMSTYTYGYYAMLLLVICSIVSILSQTYVKPTPINSLIVEVIAIFVIQSLAFFFAYMLTSMENIYLIYLKKILPMCLYTVLTSIPMYYIGRKMANSFKEDDDDKI